MYKQYSQGSCKILQTVVKARERTDNLGKRKRNVEGGEEATENVTTLGNAICFILSTFSLPV